MLCIAHRGGPGPENSLEGIRRSLSAGTPAIEIDVWQCHGELWVMHDRRLGREIGGHEVITDLSLEQIEALRLSNGEPIPRLQQVLELVGERALLNIEMKGLECAPALTDLLTAYSRDAGHSLDPYVISGFDHRQLLQVQQALPEVRRGLLLYGVPLDIQHSLDALAPYSVNISMDFMREDLIQTCRDNGKKLWVYTANHPTDWRRLIDAGMDGIFTDHPDALMRYLHNG